MPHRRLLAAEIFGKKRVGRLHYEVAHLMIKASIHSEISLFPTSRQIAPPFVVSNCYCDFIGFGLLLIIRNMSILLGVPAYNIAPWQSISPV